MEMSLWDMLSFYIHGKCKICDYTVNKKSTWFFTVISDF